MIATSRRWSLVLLALMAVARPAAASPVPTCADVFVAEALHLVCRAEHGPGADDWRLVVEPTNHSMAGLTRLDVRPVDEPIDDPPAWLQDQVRLGLDEISASLEDLLESPSNPIVGSPLNESIKDLLQYTDSLNDAPLSGCQEPIRRESRKAWQMTCRWGIGDIESRFVLRLLERPGKYQLVTIHAMTEQRLRHLLAIANSL